MSENEIMEAGVELETPQAAAVVAAGATQAVAVTEAETLAMQIPMALREPPNIGDAMDVRGWIGRLVASLQDGGGARAMGVREFWSRVLATRAAFDAVYITLVAGVNGIPMADRLVDELAKVLPPLTTDDCRQAMVATADLLRFLRK